MRAINNVLRAESEELVAALSEALYSRKNDLGFQTFPIIFAVRYVKDAKTNLLVPHYMSGILNSQKIDGSDERGVNIYSSTDEGDKMLYISMANNMHQYAVGDEPMKFIRGDMPIPLSCTLRDVEGKTPSLENLANRTLKPKENIVNLFFGDQAFNHNSKYAMEDLSAYISTFSQRR